ncbi:zinc finger BED domain-containing protein 4-like [Saccostrea cucullata]|uniref:zinc finger BED domain-containing protein 4-like n=1 Tax=Saccostrea cuccullata TaxID=36930 RepID=UPI002ED127AC
MNSRVLDEFNVPDNVSGNFKAKCKHCESYISGSTKATSNFLTHVKRKHRDAYLRVIEVKKEDQGQSKIITFTRGTSKYSSNDPNQQQITDALLHFIAGDLLPLSIVDSKYFQNLMEKVNPKYQLPSRKHLSTTLIQEKSTEIRNELKENMARAVSLCLTVDIWSNRQMRGFLGITGHYIHEWQMKSVMICCKRFKGKHSAENIRHEYEETVSSYDIYDKINNIISDNAANMVKAFDFALPGFQEEHKSITEEESESDDEDNCDVDNDMSELCEEIFPKHSRCYAHTLQLVVKDGLGDCSPSLKSIIAKASNIVSFVRKSVVASEMLEDEQRLQAANITSWNSQLHMLRSILKVPESKLNSLDTKYKLSTYERKLLQELCQILDPFEHATLLVQQEINVSASLTIPITLGIKHQLRQISAIHSNKMIQTLVHSVESRLSPFEENETFILAAVLDPRFKIRWCKSGKVEEIVALLKERTNNVQTQDIDDLTSPESPPTKKGKTDFFSFLPPSTPKRKRHVSGPTTEMDIYLGEDCTEMSESPLTYWSQNHSRFPCLSKLAQRYLAVPATSAPVERLFSVAGKIFRPERCRLSDSIKTGGKERTFVDSVIEDHIIIREKKK